MSENIVFISNSTEETEKFAKKIAQRLCADEKSRIFVCLFGDLGAGKTAFVRGFASEIAPASRVKSPSYTVVNEYRSGKTPLFHFDLYRIEDDEDALVGLGFDEYTENGHCILEWSEYLPKSLMPENAIGVTIEKLSETSRKITVNKI